MGEREIDARSDIYALGAVTYEMLLGRARRSPAPTAQAIVAKVLTEEPPPAHGRGGHTIPPHIESAGAHGARQAAGRPVRERRRVCGGPRQPCLAQDDRSIAAHFRRPVRWWPTLTVGLLGIGVGFAAARLSTPGTEPAHRYLGERLSGPRVALYPQVSPDGKTVAFAAMEGRQTQVGINAESGDWKVLTHDSTRAWRSRSPVGGWEPDLLRALLRGAARRLQHLTPGGDDRLVLPDAACPIPLSDGSLLVWRYVRGDHPQLFRYWSESGRLDTLQAFSIRDDQGHLGGSFPANGKWPSSAAPARTGRWTRSSRSTSPREKRGAVTHHRRRGIGSLAVTPDGQVLSVEVVATSTASCQSPGMDRTVGPSSSRRRP